VSESRASRPDELADFAGRVSHDLKNPLSAITMSLEMAREEASDLGLDDHALGSLLERAARGAARLQGMIDDLHDYALAGTPSEVGPVDLAVLVGELDAALPTTDELPVAGDADQLRLVLRHLVGNAATHTRPGRPTTVTVTASRASDTCRVEVTDDGRGVPEADRERVFEPMVRLDTTVLGTGLGLATCRRVVEAHGGRIGLGEAAGGGTVAWFELPAG